VLWLLLIGCLYYCINDARSHKHQIHRVLISFAPIYINPCIQQKVRKPTKRPKINCKVS